MQGTIPEALAALRLLVCMAKADGVLHPDERQSLLDALKDIPLPAGTTLDDLLAEENDPRALARQITTQNMRDCAYASVYTMAYCDKVLAEPENKLLEMLRAAWNINAVEEKLLSDTLKANLPEPAHSAGVTDEAQRRAEFDGLLKRYCLLTAITGAIPLPILPDLLVVPMQVKMVYDIASLFGQKTDKHTVQLMFETLGVGTGVRIATSALAKMVPGWGTVVGSASAFTSTFALAKVAWAYFETEGKASLESLKPLFREQQAAARDEFKKHEASLQEASREHSATLKQLANDLRSGKITQEEYAKRVDALG